MDSLIKNITNCRFCDNKFCNVTSAFGHYCKECKYYLFVEDHSISSYYKETFLLHPSNYPQFDFEILNDKFVLKYFSQVNCGYLTVDKSLYDAYKISPNYLRELSKKFILL